MTFAVCICYDGSFPMQEALILFAVSEGPDQSVHLRNMIWGVNVRQCICYSRNVKEVYVEYTLPKSPTKRFRLMKTDTLAYWFY